MYGIKEYDDRLA